MTEPIITCPECNAQIKLTESLAAPLIEATRADYEKKLAQKDEAVAKREQAVRDKEKLVSNAQKSIEDTVGAKVTEQLKSERVKIVAEESKKAKNAAAAEIEAKDKTVAELNELLESRNQKLAEAQKAQADVVKKQRELDDATRELELTVQQRVQENLIPLREKAKQEAEEVLKLKVTERDQTIAAMQKQIEELKRRAEQGSQQLQGEALELELEALLKSKFPYDTIEPVPKGEHGGDALQKVINTLGHDCGTIIWESKRTKAWSDNWLPKLRDDQRTAKAEIAILVSQTLPKGTDSFDHIEGIWVIHPRVIMPVATMLRYSLLEVTSARQASEGQQTKMELVYQYLTGPRFKQRIQAIVEAFSTMQEDLNVEKKVITKQWFKRGEQIERVMQSTVGMYGDLQGIAGQTLQEIEGLELRALDQDESLLKLG